MPGRWGQIGCALLLLLAGCATLPENFQRPQTCAFNDTGNTPLAGLRAASRSAHPGKSGFHLLNNGLDAFAARASLADLAERSLDVQYYLYHDDMIGRLMTDQLLKAADRGVRVRLLVDDMGLDGRDLSVATLDGHPNVEVRIFNPFSRNVGRTSQYVTRLGSVTRRMHNKTFTVDNQVTILGGRNIGNEYFDANPDLVFADLDVMAIGPLVGEVSALFDQYWNCELAYPARVLVRKPPTRDQVARMRLQIEKYVSGKAGFPYLEVLGRASVAEQILEDRIDFGWGDAQLVYDQPEKVLQDTSRTELTLGSQLQPYWEGLEEEVIIFSPYFVPGKPLAKLLIQLAGRGVRVRILTNSLASNDVGLVHAGYAKYRKALLRAGVELYEMNRMLTREQRKAKKGREGRAKASLHAKSFVFDRKEVFIGSLNLDHRAMIQNTEVGVVIDISDIAEEMAQTFERTIAQSAFRLALRKRKSGRDRIVWHGRENGKPVVYTHEPYSGFWRRFGIGFLSLLPIESQL